MKKSAFIKRKESEFPDSVKNFIGKTDKSDVTINAVEWMGLSITLIIINRLTRPAEETILLMEDLLHHTLSRHRIQDFENLCPEEYYSPQFFYHGMTVLHSSLKDAIDFAAYLQNFVISR
jgi:hypothetical protein